MPSPHPAVTPSAITVARKYGKNVSRGIIEMQRCIGVLEAANKKKTEKITEYKNLINRLQPFEGE